MSPSASPAETPFVFGSYASHTRDLATSDRAARPRRVHPSEPDVDEAPPASAPPETAERRPWTLPTSETAGLDELFAVLSDLTADQHASLQETLEHVTALAISVVPSAAGVGVAVADEPLLSVATEAYVTDLDATQARLGQGPWIVASRTSRLVISGAVSEDWRWPGLRSHTAHLGIVSALSVPLVTEGNGGALNLYATERDAFDDRDRQVAQLVAAPAAVALQNAQLLNRTRQLAVQLQAALDHRGIIERAIGSMTSRNCTTEDQALSRLRRMSLHQRQDLHSVAHTIIDEAMAEVIARRQR